MTRLGFPGAARQTVLQSCVALCLALPAAAATKANPGTPGSADEKSNAGRALVTEPAAGGAGTLPGRQSFFTVGLGCRFLLNDPQSLGDMRRVADDNILRPNEPIYNSSGIALSGPGTAFAPEPALRAEYQVYLERSAWFSIIWSIEGGYAPAREALFAAGNFRYLNAEATNAALADVTYTGSLSVTERRFQLTPAAGVGVDYTNAWLTRLGETHLLARLSLGVMVASGQRLYTLSLAPRYIGAVNDTYAIQSEITQSHTMSLLPAARAEFGARARLWGRLHIALLFSLTGIYGNLGWQSVGFFAERAGPASAVSNYQKIVSTTQDQAHLGLAPGIFLALTTEL